MKMKEYICKKDFYIEDVKFASVGDHLILMTDNSTVVNTSGEQKVHHYPEIVGDSEYFTQTFETPASKIERGEDKVNHPDHYTWLREKCGIEVIDITRHLDFDTGNAVKYLLRAGHKGEEGMTDVEKTIEDLQKAVWYINDKIDQLKYGNYNNR